MLLPLFSTTATIALFKRFRRSRSASSAVEFALIAPMFFAMLFALFETALIFFAGQVLENGVQDSGRKIYTDGRDAYVDAAAFKADLCKRTSELFTCDGISVDARTYPAGTAIPTAVPYDSAGQANSALSWNVPAANAPSPSTVVIRAFYQWPLVVTQLGYNIANVNRNMSDSKRLMVATAAFRVEPR